MNWNELAQMRVGDVKPPPILPVGHYDGLIVGDYKTGNSSQKQTPFVTYEVKLNGARGDVDQSALAEIYDPFGRTQELTFWLSPNALYILTDFAKALGCSDQATIPECADFIKECGEPIVVSVEHEPNRNNPDRPRVRLGFAVAATTYEEREAQAA